jgi:hypothetical protein
MCPRGARIQRFVPVRHKPRKAFAKSRRAMRMERNNARFAISSRKNFAHGQARAKPF